MYRSPGPGPKLHEYQRPMVVANPIAAPLTQAQDHSIAATVTELYSLLRTC